MNNSLCAKFAKPGRPKAMSDECQKAVITAAAREIFLADGYGGMTMDDVAAKCGMSKKTLYRLFSSKQAMLIEIVSQHRVAMVALPGDYDHLSVEEALEAIFRLEISDEEDLERLALLRLMKTESARSKEVLDILMEYAAGEGSRLLKEWMIAQCDKGILQTEDVPLTVDILFDMIFGAIVKKTEPGCELPNHADRKAKMRLAIRIFVNGCRAKTQI
jgi:TetR/AcrR family transcriptional repressor of mexJK operon